MLHLVPSKNEHTFSQLPKVSAWMGMYVVANNERDCKF